MRVRFDISTLILTFLERLKQRGRKFSLHGRKEIIHTQFWLKINLKRRNFTWQDNITIDLREIGYGDVMIKKIQDKLMMGFYDESNEEYYILIYSSGVKIPFSL